MMTTTTDDVENGNGREKSHMQTILGGNNPYSNASEYLCTCAYARVNNTPFKLKIIFGLEMKNTDSC